MKHDSDLDPLREPLSYEEFDALFVKELTKRTATNNHIFGFMGLLMLIILLDFFAAFVFAGILLWFAILTRLSDPVYQLFRKVYRLQDTPLYLVKPPFGQSVIACISLIFPSYFIYVGIRAMIAFEFCNQTIICLLVDIFR